MNVFVFVMYNSKLMSRQCRRQRQVVEYDIDDVSSDDERMTEKEEPILPPQKEWIRSLDRIARNDAVVDKENESDIENDVENIVNNLAEACTRSSFDEAKLILFHVHFTTFNLELNY